MKYWITAGRPAYSGVNALGSFETWVEVMGGILESVGVEGFLANQNELVDLGDEEGHLFDAFLKEWWQRHQGRAVHSTDLLEIAMKYYEDELGSGSTRSQSSRLGKLLGKHRDHVCNGKALRLSRAKGLTQYRLSPLPKGK